MPYGKSAQNLKISLVPKQSTNDNMVTLDNEMVITE